MARVTTGVAAAALGKERRTLQRWAKREGYPADAAGLVDVDELRAWAHAAGLLERGAHDGPRTGVERALAEAAPVAAAPAVQRAAAAVQAIELDGEAGKLLDALESDDRAALLRQGLGADPKLLKKLEAVGRARAALADAVKRELDNQVRRRDLLVRADVVAGVRGIVQDAKSALEVLPAKLAARLADRPYDEVYAAIEAEVAVALAALAAGAEVATA